MPKLADPSGLQYVHVFQRYDVGTHNSTTHNIGFSKVSIIALSGFLMMMTQNGKLLYISDNAAEYLGHSMVSLLQEDLLIHGDSVYDIIDKQDHQMIQAELGSPNSGHRPGSIAEGERKMFLCRMNVSRNARRQMRFGDQKIVLVQGHFLSFLSLCSRNEPVFLATCSPVAMPETRECVVHGATNVFTTIHTMDMKVLHVDKNGEFYLGFTRSELQGASWYQLLHWEIAREAQSKHRLITQSEQDRSCILLLRMQRRTGDWLWVHCVLQVKDGADSAQQPVIVCTNQVLSDREAAVLRLNGWLYSFYSVQNKLQYELSFDVPKSGGSQHSGSAYASTAYYPGHMSIPAQHQLTPGFERTLGWQYTSIHRLTAGYLEFQGELTNMRFGFHNATQTSQHSMKKVQ
ncbi:neuronal PAS domain-containing protein 4-like [Ctenocephalides felis]|uniref:neuronal PAS domain-containing protein 4-like n=1 Tax=Ctenocephalides felis TaxID=7515 RepID=UPI000E6E59A8|nr:neuronal PAS domain-containing protein 4-like [Ctenocephalides felis]